ncbi:hypothetical protein BH20ACI3_BH20ACI3_39800 [soil metagenome]
MPSVQYAKKKCGNISRVLRDCAIDRYSTENSFLRAHPKKYELEFRHINDDQRSNDSFLSGKPW